MYASVNDVGYLPKSTDVRLLSSITGADLILFDCRTSGFHIKRIEGNFEYSVRVPNDTADILRNIHFPLGATNIQLFYDDEPILVKTIDGSVKYLKYPMYVSLQPKTIKLSYCLNPANFPGGVIDLDLKETAHLGCLIFSVGWFSASARKAQLTSTKDVIVQILRTPLVQ